THGRAVVAASHGRAVVAASHGRAVVAASHGRAVVAASHGRAVVAATQGKQHAARVASFPKIPCRVPNTWWTQREQQLQQQHQRSNLEHGQQPGSAWGEGLAQQQESNMEQHTGVVQEAERRVSKRQTERVACETESNGNTWTPEVKAWCKTGRAADRS
ncbi:unnamed protein product, partial [Closterium sp. NIES-53]